MTINTAGGRLTGLSGNKCPKGGEYARQEIENPMRILTSSVVAEDLDMKMVPVRTNRPVPKGMLFPAMDEIKKFRLARAVRAGDILIADLLGTGADVVSARDAHRMIN